MYPDGFGVGCEVVVEFLCDHIAAAGMVRQGEEERDELCVQLWDCAVL